MTPDEFDKATPQERNEAIALALGFSRFYKSHGALWGYRGNSVIPDYVPNWQGDDGLAFKELWPEIVWSNGKDSGLLLGLSDGDKSAVMELRDGLPWMEFVFDGDTWAHAICKAFLALKQPASKEGL